MVSKIAESSRSQGGQKKRWYDLIYTDLKKLNIIDTWKTKARNRNDWRKNIKSLSQKTNEEAERNEQSKKDLKKNIFDVHSKSSSFQRLQQNSGQNGRSDKPHPPNPQSTIITTLPKLQ